MHLVSVETAVSELMSSNMILHRVPSNYDELHLQLHIPSPRP